MSKRVMLFGAAGQVSQALRHEPLPEGWDLGLYTRAECDITSHGAVQSAMREFKPDLVINTAAMTAVDTCETQHDEAMAANFDAPANLASQCSALDIPLIHLSTDYVFDGKDGDIPYTTDAAMNPLSVYGHSKMMGEEAIRHGHPWHVILRVSSVFSAYGANLLPKMLQLLETRDELKIVTDQKGCPTAAPEIAKALLVMSDAILNGKSNGFGTFHLCGAGESTRFEFVEAILEAYLPYTTRRPVLKPALSSDFPGFAERPSYSVLDCSRILEVYGIAQKPWRDGLQDAMKQLMTERQQEVLRS